MKIATVVPMSRGGARDELTYFTTKEIAPGSVVEVNLRNKKTLGLVLGVEDAEERKTEIKNFDFNLKKITEIKEASFFRREYIESIFAASKYFASKKSDMAVTLIPKIFREEYNKFERLYDKKSQTDAIDTKIKAEKLLFQTKKESRISQYKALIRGSFAQKKSVFIVLPTEHDISEFHKELVRGIEKYTFVFHSGIKDKKIIDAVAQAVKPDHPVLILGTSPYLSIPRRDIGTIILEHESSTAYRSLTRPYFDLRVFVEIFAQRIRAKLIIADTLLRFETIARKEAEILPSVEPLNFRTEFTGEIKIVSPEKAAGTRNDFQILAEETLARINHAIEKKKNVFIFSLRKGLATFTVCRDCGNTLYCARCNAPIVLYISHDGTKRMFACNRCKRQLDPTTTCPHCYSWNLLPLGIGTDTVVEKLKEAYGDKKIKIYKLDKESVKTAKGAKEMAKKFEAESGAILVGTEMAFNYLSSTVGLAVVSSFDSLWSIPHFKMGEKVLNILLSALNKTEGDLVIQTKNMNDRAVLAVESRNFLQYVREELKDRKDLNYPPYARFIKIIHFGDKEATINAKVDLKEVFKEYNPEIFSGFISKIKGRYVTNALIKLAPHEWSLPELLFRSNLNEPLLQKLLALPPAYKVIVDPEDLL